jgi:hypothetical protein
MKPEHPTVLDVLARVFAPGEKALYYGSEVRIVHHYDDDHYQIVFPCGMWRGEKVIASVWDLKDVTAS